jgi:hypothetical protein
MLIVSGDRFAANSRSGSGTTHFRIARTIKFGGDCLQKELFNAIA